MAEKPAEIESTRWSLIGRLKNLEDQDSWREFFDLYWKLIFNMARRAGLNSADAEDVVQETIISVTRSITKFKADPLHGSFKNWLLRLTKWRITDQFRKRKPVAQLKESYNTPIPPPNSECIEQESHPCREPKDHPLEKVWEEEWKRNVMDQGLERVKRQVSSRQFQIFFLHVIKNKSAECVAKVLNINTNQVYVNKHRLSALLKEAVANLEKKMM